MKKDDLLIEIQTEELPPKSLAALATHLKDQIGDRLQKVGLAFEHCQAFATPRRLAVLVTGLASATTAQVVERRGPARAAAFDDSGKPTAACEGFAKSCGVSVEDLQVLKTAQGEWMGYQQSVPGKPMADLLQASVFEPALAALPISKRMRWGSGETMFVRPVHGVLVLYGDTVVPAVVLGCKAGRQTVGHRFHAPQAIAISSAGRYLFQLEDAGKVIADMDRRRDLIRQEAFSCARQTAGNDASVLISSDALLDEVTGLVEWPVALCGQFEKTFLALPREVLISAMQDHQRYFPVVDKAGDLLPYFVTISNIESRDAKRVIHGNERVLRARLADAAFFFAEDKKESLAERAERLKGIVFQAKLGTLYDKTNRVQALATWMANTLGLKAEDISRAAFLAKADLTTNMVNEFPELQGVMGGYYAVADGERPAVAEAIAEHYYPRFAGDLLPTSVASQVLSMADRIDTLVGAFATKQIPTGDKDPFGLRRAALGVLRILVEKKINLDLRAVLSVAVDILKQQMASQEKPSLVVGDEVVPSLLPFMQERLRSWYQEQGVAADVFAAVAAVGMDNPLDADLRIRAVQLFKTLAAAEALSVANKRVSNILSKAELVSATHIDPAYFETNEEKVLAKQLEEADAVIAKLFSQGKYDEALLRLAELRQPIDAFFDHVMVMAEDKPRRENRLLLLGKLRQMFLRVADIALLQLF